MKLFGFLGLGLIVSTAFASIPPVSMNEYDLRMELSLNGRHSSFPHAVVKEGRTAMITQSTKKGEEFIEVTPTESRVQGKAGTVLKINFGKVAKNGSHHTSFHQEIFVPNDSKHAYSTYTAGTDRLSLSIIEEKKSL